jgi:hypothetical protein
MPPVPVPTSSSALLAAADAGLDPIVEPADGEPAPEEVLPELHAASRATAATARAASRSGRGRRVTMVLLGK